MTHKFGLVLAGGGARGMAHAGVLRALNHLGYYPSAIAGYSMGSVVGAAYALGSVQNLSHFRSCDGGSIGLKFHLV